VNLQKDYKGNKKLICSNEQYNKTKTELRSILDKNEKLVWIQDANFKTRMEHFIQLLNGQTHRENITENNYTAENSNAPDK
jgi:hypothetical protein